MPWLEQQFSAYFFPSQGAPSSRSQPVSQKVSHRRLGKISQRRSDRSRCRTAPAVAADGAALLSRLQRHRRRRELLNNAWSVEPSACWTWVMPMGRVYPFPLGLPIINRFQPSMEIVRGKGILAAEKEINCLNAAA